MKPNDDDKQHAGAVEDGPHETAANRSTSVQGSLESVRDGSYVPQNLKQAALASAIRTSEGLPDNFDEMLKEMQKKGTLT